MILLKMGDTAGNLRHEYCDGKRSVDHPLHGIYQNDPRWKDCGITGNCYWNEVRVNSNNVRRAYIVLHIFVWCNLKNCDTIYLRVAKEHRHK